VLDEAFMEDCIEENPSAFLGQKLKVIGRQPLLGGFRPDLICSNGDEVIIIEIQQRALDRVHLYKCLEYRDLLTQKKTSQPIRILVICNAIEEKYKPIAETHGVEVKEIERAQFLSIAAKSCPKSVEKALARFDARAEKPRPKLATKIQFRPFGWSDHVSPDEI